MTHALRKLPDRSDAPGGSLRAGSCAFAGGIGVVIAPSPLQSRTLRMHASVDAAH